MKCEIYRIRFYKKSVTEHFLLVLVFPGQSATGKQCGSVTRPAGMTGGMRCPVLGAGDGNTAVPPDRGVM